MTLRGREFPVSSRQEESLGFQVLCFFPPVASILSPLSLCNEHDHSNNGNSQAPVPSQFSKRLVKMSPDEDVNPGEQRQAVALTHLEFRGHHRAQSVGAKGERTETSQKLQGMEGASCQLGVRSRGREAWKKKTQKTLDICGGRNGFSYLQKTRASLEEYAPFARLSVRGPRPVYVTHGAGWADSPLVFWAAAPNGNSSCVKRPGAEKTEMQFQPLSTWSLFPGGGSDATVHGSPKALVTYEVLRTSPFPSVSLDSPRSPSLTDIDLVEPQCYR